MDVSHIALAQVTISVAKTDFEISSKPTLRVPSGGSQMRHERTFDCNWLWRTLLELLFTGAQEISYLENQRLRIAVGW
jgi:hypothetical protein